MTLTVRQEKRGGHRAPEIPSHCLLFKDNLRMTQGEIGGILLDTILGNAAPSANAPAEWPNTGFRSVHQAADVEITVSKRGELQETWPKMRMTISKASLGTVADSMVNA